MRSAFLFNFFASAGIMGGEKGKDKKIFQHVGKISKLEKTPSSKLWAASMFSHFSNG